MQIAAPELSGLPGDIAAALVSHMRENYADQVAVVAYYGSQARGTASKRSDLDVFFIPAGPAGYGAGTQVIVAGLSVDFWPVSWERAERMASFDDAFTSVIADCRPLYFRCDTDRERFEALRVAIAEAPIKHDLSFPGKAQGALSSAFLHLHRLKASSDTTPVHLLTPDALGIVTSVFQSLALLNRTYLASGWGRNTEQVRSFALRPTRLDEYLRVILHSPLGEEALDACEKLLNDTIALVLKESRSLRAPTSYADRLTGFFEEAVGTIDKIVGACDMGDGGTAVFAATSLQDEVTRALYEAETGVAPGMLEDLAATRHTYDEAGLPDLLPFLRPLDLDGLRDAVLALTGRLEQHLLSNGVPVKRFESVADLRRHLGVGEDSDAGEGRAGPTHN